MSRSGFSRRSLLAAAAGATAIGALSAAAQQKTLAVQIWGTTWQSVVKAIAQEYQEKYGVTIEPVMQASSGEGLVKLQSNHQKPNVDVWFTTSSVAERAVADKELFAPIPEKEVPNLAELKPGAHALGWVAAYYYPVGIIYRPDMVSKPVTSWNDLWDPSLAHKLAVPNTGMYQGAMLLIAAMLNGGTEDNVDPGFAALIKLRPNVAIFYSSDAQAREALASGEVAVLVAPPSQAKRMRDQGISVKMISPKPSPMLFDAMTIVRDGKEDEAARFINFVISAPVQTMISDKLGMGPVNRNAKPSATLEQELPKPGDAVALNDAKINAHIAEWTDRFNREVAR